MGNFEAQFMLSPCKNNQSIKLEAHDKNVLSGEEDHHLVNLLINYYDVETKGEKGHVLSMKKINYYIQ